MSFNIKKQTFVSFLIQEYNIYKKLPQKWRKCDLVSGDHLCDQRYGLAMNWVDRPRTSADERVLSGRRTVVIV